MIGTSAGKPAGNLSLDRLQLVSSAITAHSTIPDFISVFLNSIAIFLSDTCFRPESLHDEQVLSASDLAKQFGKRVSDFKKVLKLGGVNKERRSLCRDGKITIDTLAAFTVTDDKEQQLKAYRAAKKQRSVYSR